MEDEKTTENVAPTPEKEEEPQEEKEETIKEKIEKIEKGAYERRKEELAEIEKRVDTKIKELKSIFGEIEAQGKGLMAIKPSKKEEMKKKYEKMGALNPFRGKGEEALEDVD